MRAVRHPRKPVAFLEELFPGGFRHVQREDLFAHFIGFLLRVVLLAELARDRAHLLAQHVGALVFVHLLLRLLGDLPLQRHHLNLVVQNRIQAHDAAHRVQLVENGLLLLEIERDIRRDEIRELPAVLLLHHTEQDIRRHMAEPADVLLEFFLRDAAQRFGLVACAEIRLRTGQDGARQKRLLLHDRHDLRAGDALDMQLDTLVCGVHNLLDLRDDADFIEVFRRRLVFGEIRLRDDEDLPAGVQRGLYGQHGLFAADVKL